MPQRRQGPIVGRGGQPKRLREKKAMSACRGHGEDMIKSNAHVLRNGKLDQQSERIEKQIRA